MVKHVILWKLKEEHNTVSVKQAMKSELEGLVGKVPGLIEMDVQISGLASSNADVMLYSVLEDEKALKEYATHPAHVFVADTYVRPFAQSRLCLDFEV
ncbi:MAG: Dabb family protein [Clostridia bacterium]|nr:Dabb family protein [Clostridia bacterium]